MAPTRATSGTLAAVDDFRCSAASRGDDEPLAGSAPTERTWLLVEYAGPWGRAPVAESRWPGEVRAALAALDGVRVQLIRRPTPAPIPPPAEAGLRVFAATADERGFSVGAATLTDPEDLIALTGTLDPAVPGAGLPAYDAPLWLVCTNGRRDRCCAELGRPVAAALAAARPDATWETTHLGGHRFAGTLLALPTGLTLGRVGAEEVDQICGAVERGELPDGRVRGRAGLSGPAQVAELHVRAEQAARGARVVAGVGGTVEVTTPEATYVVTVVETPGPERRQSCADDRVKATTRFTVASVQRHS